jgi:hypothetical protein
MSGEHIQAVQSFECADDVEVILKSSALLNSQSKHPAAEIWEGKRLVARLTKNSDAKTQQVDAGP